MITPAVLESLQLGDSLEMGCLMPAVSKEALVWTLFALDGSVWDFEVSAFGVFLCYASARIEGESVVIEKSGE